VDAQCVILEILFVLQPYLIDLAPEPIFFFDVNQILLVTHTTLASIKRIE
jgi:hypothetical protein